MDRVPVHIQLKGFLAWSVPEADIIFDVDKGTTLADVVIHLSDHHDKRFRKTILNADGVPDNIFFYTLNGKIITYPQLKEIKIHQSSKIVIFPIAAGG